MITKDGRDLSIDKITPDNYVVPRGEEKDYHCIIEVVQYDQSTGQKLSRPRVQKFGRKIFERSVHASLKKQGYKVTILHDPTAWLAAQAEARGVAAKEAAAAKAKAEEERFNEAVAAAVAKALAEAEQAKKKKKTES